MIIETTCERGIVRLPMELKFQHDTFNVKVEVPDQEISLSPSVATEMRPRSENSLGIRAQIDAILGPYKNLLRKGAPLSAQDYKDIWHQHIEEKHLGRK